MQINKTYAYTAIGLVAAAALTSLLLLRAPKKSADAVAEAGAGLNKPRALSVAPDGALWVADSRNHRLVKQDAGGNVIKTLGRQGSGDGQFKEPCGVWVDKAGLVYVADTFHSPNPDGGFPWGRVQKFSAEGVFMGAWGKVSVPPNDLFGPRAIAADSKGNVYLADTGNHRIIKYSDNGSFLSVIGKGGKAGSAVGEFKEPFGLALDKSDNLYVADRLNFRVQVFSPAGKPLRQIKVDGWEDNQINQEPYLAVDSKRGYLYVSDPTKRKVHRYGLSGGGHVVYDKGVEAAFKQPTGVAVRESDGVVFVTDGETGKVLTLRP